MGQANKRGTYEQRRAKAIVRNSIAIHDMSVLDDWHKKTTAMLEAQASILITAGQIREQDKLEWIKEKFDRLSKELMDEPTTQIPQENEAWTTLDAKETKP